MAVSHAGLGGLVYGAVALFDKKQAGGLPDKTLLVVTPSKVHVYKASIKGRGFKAGDEVAVWDRDAVQASTEQKSGVTMLTRRVARRGREGHAGARRGPRRSGQPGADAGAQGRRGHELAPAQ